MGDNVWVVFILKQAAQLALLNNARADRTVRFLSAVAMQMFKGDKVQAKGHSGILYYLVFDRLYPLLFYHFLYY